MGVGGILVLALGGVVGYDSFGPKVGILVPMVILAAIFTARWPLAKLFALIHQDSSFATPRGKY